MLRWALIRIKKLIDFEQQFFKNINFIVYSRHFPDPTVSIVSGELVKLLNQEEGDNRFLLRHVVKTLHSLVEGIVRKG